MGWVPGGVPVERAAVVLALAASLAVVRLLDRRWSRKLAALRGRFVAGVPWGTVVSALFVLAVYLFLQGGWSRWNAPVALPFTAWSYFYPLGVLAAAFSHAGPGHLIGNLVGTLTLAPLAEYAWGHFPRERGASSFGSWRTNPYVRAFVLFPLGVVAVGLLNAALGLGPVIGFSGVVFAFAGFALVYFPLATVLALVAGQAVRLAYWALADPVSTAASRPTFSTPWFADIAIQGHLLGLLLGAAIALRLARRRGDEPPAALRLWTGVLLFAVAQSLWAVYWFRGNGVFVLYRAWGLVLVTLLAGIVTAAATASDRRPLARVGGAAPDPETLRGFVAGLTSRELAVALLLVCTAAVAGPAVGVNLLFAVGDDDLPGESVTVRDYEVTYAENVSDGMIAVIDAEAFGERTSVNTSGVIVRSEEREIWTTAVSKSRLAFAGSARIHLGGVGWRETVVATREGWKPVGTEPVYRVSLGVDGASKPVYASPRSTAEPVVMGRNVSVVAERSGFSLAVTRGNETTRGPLPGPDETVAIDGLTFTREGRKLFASAADTKVRIASKERHRG
ncbi:rhomboid family intramembrane serine protease [Halegenticoccus soli]|uniref:rhomboid family intramembrane serine protease n=1 Tax=Halegenticoccus soli TaxID=1985678 RepID=UPI000C6E9DBB|nr:rhomboid family intramembrane serine protease [Halegenticoccus soli]